MSAGDVLEQFRSACSAGRIDAFAIGDTLLQACGHGPATLAVPITLGVRDDQLQALTDRLAARGLHVHRRSKLDWLVGGAPGCFPIELTVFFHHKGTLQHSKYPPVRLTRSMLHPIQTARVGEHSVPVPSDPAALVDHQQLLRNPSVYTLHTTGKTFRSVGAMGTVRFLLDHPGHSLARFGDGELECMVRLDSCSQRTSRLLARRLQQVVLQAPANLCLGFVQKDADYGYGGFKGMLSGRFDAVLDRMDADRQTMFSAYVGRVDLPSEPERDQYWRTIRQLFRHRKVVMVGNDRVRGYHRSELYAEHDQQWPIRFITQTPDGQEIPGRDSFRVYDGILSQCLEVGRQHPDVLFCLEVGVTATVLAYDLCCAGYQAYDLGRTSYFHRAWCADVASRPVTLGRGA